jgi:predicted nucleotidyltransferase
MLTQEKILEILRKELPYFASKYGVKRIGIFGSYAKGVQRKDSDVDILVEFEKPIGLKFVEFGEYLEQVLGKKTDILTPAGVEGIRLPRVAKDIKENIIYVEQN